VPLASLAERARRKPGLSLLLVALVAWTAGLAGALVGVKLAGIEKAPARTPSTLGLVKAEPRGEALPAMDAYTAAAAIGPSVVAIQSLETINGGTLRGSGTGVVLTADGEIVTNQHVVGNATTVQVRLPGESEPRTASVVAADPRRDLALVHVDATALHPATFTDPADVRVGDHVLAVGYALNLDGDPSVTDGIVSALNRTSADQNKALRGLIQTDAPISSGNSGGPLVNSLGQVVGLITFVATSENGSQANNLGFAIGNTELQAGITALRAAAGGAPLVDGYLGVQLGKRTDGGSGALVVDVVASSPAGTAGLLVGDVVVAVDGSPISGQAALIATIRDHRPGDSLTIDVRRKGAPLTLTAVLVDRPAG
jgi:S1-C subfamily serine protease